MSCSTRGQATRDIMRWTETITDLWRAEAEAIKGIATTEQGIQDARAPLDKAGSTCDGRDTSGKQTSPGDRARVIDSASNRVRWRRIATLSTDERKAR